MRRIVLFLWGILLVCVGIGMKQPVLAIDDMTILEAVSVEVMIDGMTTQTELMNDTVVEGTVSVTDRSSQTEETIVAVAAFSNGELQQSQVLYTGMLSSGVTNYQFRLDNLKRADKIKAYILWKDSMEICCPVAEDALLPAQVIVFKFDDLRPTVGNQTARFNKAMSYLSKEGIPATAGILGKWLEDAKTNPKKYQNQISLIKSWILAGHQLWIHGYDHSAGEFAALKETPASTYKEQRDIICKTYDLMETVLQYRTTCFSASYNQNNEDTISVLNCEFPQIQTVMFMHDTNSRLHALNLSSDHICEIETGTGIVSSQLFFARYEFVKELPYFVIQAHPGQWDDQSFKELETIVKFLKTKNCVFMTPEQYQKFIS